ncbi:hypothetical protein VIGAN_01456500 [Vigna angularis var. angularis]|uniref:Secreted protein n=1 Tax=Vigna angularis var. angularis TaxID=157739 RepID=A0A0S3R7A5_PHAAN|nr:hypothetical protein VIGAN_01456500 [Vigna angularis var. angularis]
MVCRLYFFINFARWWCFVPNFDAISCICLKVYSSIVRSLTFWGCVVSAGIEGKAGCTRSTKKCSKKKTVDPDIKAVFVDSNIFKWKGSYQVGVPLRLFTRGASSSLLSLFWSSILYSHLESCF